MVSPELLRRFSLFAGLSPEAFKALALMSEEMEFRAEDWVFHEAEMADFLYLLLEGSVALLLNLDERGLRKAEVETVVVGEVLGWSAVVEPYVYKLSALAETDCKLIAIDGHELRELLRNNPGWGYTIMTRMAQTIGVRLNQMRVRLISMA
jgi:CRP-like cAMP-binding protein